MPCDLNNNITIVRGDTHTIVLNITDETTGAPVNLTGWTIFFTAKQDLNQPDSQARIAKTITSFSNPESGEVHIPLTVDDTAVAGEYFYDIQIKQGDGAISSTKRGKLIIEQDVTLRVE